MYSGVNIHHRVAEMLARFGLCALRHLLKERQRRGDSSAPKSSGENVLAKRTQHISRRIGIRVIGVHAGNDPSSCTSEPMLSIPGWYSM